MNILHYNCVLTFTKNKRGISSVLRYALHWMLPWDFKRFNGKKGIYHILLKIQSQSCKMYVHTYGCFSTENSFKENLDEEGKHGWKAFVMENKCSFLFNKKKLDKLIKIYLGADIGISSGEIPPVSCVALPFPHGPHSLECRAAHPTGYHRDSSSRRETGVRLAAWLTEKDQNMMHTNSTLTKCWFPDRSARFFHWLIAKLNI